MQRSLALGGAIFGFLVTIPLFSGFDLANPGMQFVQNLPWIARFNVSYHLGQLDYHRRIVTGGAASSGVVSPARLWSAQEENQ